jgi:3-oxoacyl-[acyl-carrier-protein] synthase-3
MATVIEHIETAEPHWRERHSTLRLTTRAARDCLSASHRRPGQVNLLINAGIYRDRNLGEPALAAMIQDDIGANPEDPHTGSHGTFSFDVANGSCGALTALQIVDGFLKSRIIDCALVVAGDADPGHRMSEGFPFSPAGAAMLCVWSADERGLGTVFWETSPDAADSFSATIGMVDHRNVLRVRRSGVADARYAQTAARAVERCLTDADLTIDDVSAIVAAPPTHEFRCALAAELSVPVERIRVADDERMHTAALPSAISGAMAAGNGSRLLLVGAGAGITAGAALYRL